MFTKFISATKEFNTIENHVNSPLFIKSFDSKIKTAKIEICVVGLYKLFLNGKDITRGLLSPYFSNPNQIVFYDEYEIDDLNIGKNEISILLGNGFSNSNDFNIWNFATASYRCAPKLALNFYQNNELKFIADELFDVFKSPITFDDYRAGERYDARLESTYLNIAKKPIIVDDPKGEIKKVDFPPIKIFDRVKAIKIIESVDGGFVFDFGDTFSGVCELNIDGVEGQVVDITFGEFMQDGKLFNTNLGFDERSNYDYVQHDQYICKIGKQKYMPNFTYHGFRFACVKGVRKEQVSKDLLTAILFYTDVTPHSEFTCDNEIINKLQKITVRSDVTNIMHFPTDCPHREKNGWTGDIALSSEQFMYNLETRKMFKTWLHTLALTQKENGAIPCIIPTDTWGYAWGAGMGWDTVITDLSLEIYRFYGDIEVLQEVAKIIVNYSPFLDTKFNKDGLLEYGIGEWCDVGSKEQYVSLCPVEVACSLLCIDFYDKCSKIFTILGDLTKADEFTKKKKTLIENFRKKYVKDCYVTCKTQGAQAWALLFDVFIEEEREQAVNNLVEFVHEKDDKIAVGALGVKALFKALSMYGQNNLAYKLVTDNRVPNYGSIIEAGLTALPERIVKIEGYPYNAKRFDGFPFESLNHHFWGSVSAWFFRYLAGINVLSFNEIEISPCFDCPLTNVHAKISIENREIEVNWEKHNNKIKLKIVNNGYNCRFIHNDKEIVMGKGNNEFEI